MGIIVSMLPITSKMFFKNDFPNFFTIMVATDATKYPSFGIWLVKLYAKLIIHENLLHDNFAT